MTEAGAEACGAVVEANALDGVTWIHSYVRPDNRKTYCVYDAPTPEAIRRSAGRNSLPISQITEVRVLGRISIARPRMRSIEPRSRVASRFFLCARTSHAQGRSVVCATRTGNPRYVLAKGSRMARTPLVDLLRRAAVIAAHARRTGHPLDEVIAEERELRVDRARRKFPSRFGGRIGRARARGLRADAARATGRRRYRDRRRRRRGPHVRVSPASGPASGCVCSKRRSA